MLKNMFKKTYTIIDTKYKSQKKEEEPSIPQGLWRKCNKCGQPIYVEDVTNNFYVCPKCGGYFRVHAWRRIEMLMDEGSFEEWDADMEFSNPLDFPGYEKKVQAAKERTKLNEAIVTGKGRISGQETAFGVCDARFLMSSMGHIVGEKIARMVERATAGKLPVIIYACSGGARAAVSRASSPPRSITAFTSLNTLFGKRCFILPNVNTFFAKISSTLKASPIIPFPFFTIHFYCLQLFFLSIFNLWLLPSKYRSSPPSQTTGQIIPARHGAQIPRFLLPPSPAPEPPLPHSSRPAS